MVMDSRSRKPLQRASGMVARHRIYITGINTVIPSLPDTSRTEGATGIILTAANTMQQIGIFKFASVPPAPASPQDMILALRKTTLFGSPTGHIISAGKTQTVEMKPYIITDDFDVATLTYNQYVALTKSQPVTFEISLMENKSGSFAGFIRYDMRGSTAIIASDVTDPTAFLTALLRGTAYGFAIELEWSQGGSFENGLFEWDITREATPKGNQLSYLEWLI